MALHRDLVGRRVVVRRLVRGERGVTGGPVFTDVLGLLEAWSDETVAVRHESGELHIIRQADVATAKPVPPRASVRRRIAPEALQRVCGAGWRAPHEQRLGDWVMRSAAGFTGRANSVLLAGDPGLPAGEALQRVSAFYAAHRRPAQVQVVVGSPWLAVLLDLGWRNARPDEHDSVVQVASVAQARRAASAPAEAIAVDLAGEPTDDWLRLYGRAADADQAVVRAVLLSGDCAGFARIGAPARAIGRGVVTGDWLGLAAVEVDPAYRRTGLARAVVDALLEWGASHGATSAYVQTLPDNIGAQALYARYGFTTHHAYRYLVAPD